MSESLCPHTYNPSAEGNKKGFRKGILIAGGVGPLAGVALHRKIIENTKTSGSDQDHLDVLHLSWSSAIDDRTAYLVNNGKVNPGEQMAGLVVEASRVFERQGRETVVGVPCNTFHADPIFGRFREMVASDGGRITIVHMIAETILWIKENQPDIKKVGLLSTTGTRKTGLYRDALTDEGYELIEVDEKEQKHVHEIIYNKDWGIKAATPVSEKARRQSENYVAQLVDKGAQGVILGCTEFPLALVQERLCDVPLIDPVRVLARALIREVSKEKLLKG